MFEIRICGIGEAKLFIESNRYTKVIGIVDPNTNVVPSEMYHIERCHDISEDLDDWIKPQIEQFQRILDFSTDFTDDDVVLFHCSAGIARSTAVAVMVLMQHGCSEKEAFDGVFAVRPHMNPNTLIISYADELLDKNGDLIQYHEEWIHDKLINPVDFAGQQGVDKNDIDVMKELLKKIQ